MDASKGSTGSCSHDSPGFWSQTIDPVAGLYRLTAHLVDAESCPKAFFFQFLIGNGTFYDENKVRCLPSLSSIKEFHKLITGFGRQQGIMEVYLRNTRDHSSNNIFYAWLGSRGHGYGIAIAAQ